MSPSVAALSLISAAAPKPPGDPPPVVLSAARGPLLQAVADAYGKARLNWATSRSALNSVQRKVRSQVSSDERRFVGEWLHGLIRHDRTIELVAQRAGLAETSRNTVNRGRALGALVGLFGLPPAAAAQAWSGEDVDWEAFADLSHSLQGWAFETNPSPEAALGAAASFPDWMARRFLALYEVEDQAAEDQAAEDQAAEGPASKAPPPEPSRTARAGALALCAALNDRARLCLRVNSQLADRESLLAELAEAGLDPEPTPLSPLGILLGRRVDVFSLPAIQRGAAEVQDEGSQLLAALVDARPGQKVVDACAGAGGKALALSAAMEGTGRVLAADVRPKVLETLRRRARRAGANNIETLPIDVDGPLPAALTHLVGAADRVLVDAPCSGSGALRRHPHDRWACRASDVHEMPDLQRAILHRFAPLVAPGGRLVYATCSLFPEENEQVVAAFLNEDPRFELQPVADVLGQAAAERIGDGRVLRLAPHLHATDGFYAAVLARRAD